jgi:hypothetical protein
MIKTSTDTSKWPKGVLNTHTEAKAIDLSEVSTFITEQGYSVMKLDQRWRHVHGIVERNNSKFFFKLASTPEIGIRTENEVAWNNAVSDTLETQSKRILIVPKVQQTGRLHGSFFYIADFYDGEFPADHDPPRTESLSQYLSSLVEVALHLNRLHVDSLWGIESDRNPQTLVKRFFDEVDRWQRDSCRNDLADLKALVEPLRNNYLPKVSHGDFVPWHVIIHGDERVLIDGEYGWSGRAKYYDVAYFYHRLSTSAARPDLARRFLSEFRDGLPQDEQVEFKSLVIPLLASRSIAGFYDATLFDDQKKLLVKHEELKTMILTGDLW